MLKQLWAAIVAACIIFAAGCAKTAAEPDLNAEIDTVITNLETAWKDADGGAWAAQFADDGDFTVWFGVRLHGAAAIGQGHQDIWDGFYAGTVFDLEIESVRLIADDVAVAHLNGWVYPADETRPETPAISKPIMVLAKHDGIWKIEAFQNTPGFGPQCFGNGLADAVARGGCIPPAAQN